MALSTFVTVSLGVVSEKVDTNVRLVLQDELKTAMRLCGVTDLDKVRGDMQYLNTRELEPLLPRKPVTGSLWFGALRPRAKL